MKTRCALPMMLFCSCLFGQAAVAVAQYPTALGQPGFPSLIYSQPTVSPYLNLLNNPNPGVTNYQSLVRPMLDERDAVARQDAKSQQVPQSQRRNQTAGKRSPDDRSQAARFLDYSHYYGNLRR